eukprot:CAMPEP_0184391294 /NCGR_PEP_ID=MMETSP0007-20130409/13986_1 /TAXON_ID=97485 /ORGANISM="Prymnesium parvum, Strain Texoma1" /LENGTH=75 /DNA_ID=CAMNT_0026741359 /DNA_START=912 /DNA_END=1139 /DNA_ORIENTATION=-
MASPVSQQNRAYAYFPATMTRKDLRRAKREVPLKCSHRASRFSGSSAHDLNAAARTADGNSNTGARLITCCVTTA